MIMTGGTLDLNNDPKNEVVRVPDGFGLIINNGSSVQAGLNVIMDGLDHTFSGVIADGNNGVLIGDNSGQGPGYQIGIVSISGTSSQLGRLPATTPTRDQPALTATRLSSWPATTASASPRPTVLPARCVFKVVPLLISMAVIRPLR